MLNLFEKAYLKHVPDQEAYILELKRFHKINKESNKHLN